MTKKLVFASVVILLLCVSLSFSGPKRAVLITDEICTLFDGDGNIVTTGDVKIVVTNSAMGNVVMKCKAKGLENSQGSAVHWDAYENPLLSPFAVALDPIECGTVTANGIELTEDWDVVVSKKGNAMMTCRFRVNKD